MWTNQRHYGSRLSVPVCVCGFNFANFPNSSLGTHHLIVKREVRYSGNVGQPTFETSQMGVKCEYVCTNRCSDRERTTWMKSNLSVCEQTMAHFGVYLFCTTLHCSTLCYIVCQCLCAVSKLNSVKLLIISTGTHTETGEWTEEWRALSSISTHLCRGNALEGGGAVHKERHHLGCQSFLFALK